MVVLVPESTTGEHETLRRSLEDLLKLMLIVWCKEGSAIKLVSGKPNETDKTIRIRKESGEFGFRIHGSKPVVVSAIEPETPAEASGLEVGDIVLAVNQVCVLDRNHSEIVKIAQAGGDSVTLEVVRSSEVLRPISAEVHGGESLYSGYLWKLGGYASGAPSTKWVRRWFTLKSDRCLYYYKTDHDNQPVGAMMLLNYQISKVDNASSSCPSRPFRFELQRNGVPTLHLAADSKVAAAKWRNVLKEAAKILQMADSRLERTKRNMILSPNALQEPDCFGYLVKLGEDFNKRYCVLKDGCLYFYHDPNAKNAFDFALLHGYSVALSSGDDTNIEIVSPDPNQKSFCFSTESDTDKRRWATALEISIDRTLKAD